MDLNDEKNASEFKFTEMTLEQNNVITEEFTKHARMLPDRILDHLRILAGDTGGFPIDRLQHCLQTATLAHQANEDEEYVVCALLHDIGDSLGPFNHADVAATILRPFVSDENIWMIEMHGIFQGYYYFHHVGMDRNMRDQYKSHPCYEKTILFCDNYDNQAFDPTMDTMPLEAFEPMLRRVLATAKNTIYECLT